jgi:hypothetical protein
VMGDDIAPFRLAKRFFSICTYTGENTMKWEIDHKFLSSQFQSTWWRLSPSLLC